MSAAAATLHLRYTQGHGWFIIERDPAQLFPSTGTNERVISGPYADVQQAAKARASYAAAFDQDGSVSS